MNNNKILYFIFIAPNYSFDAFLKVKVIDLWPFRKLKTRVTALVLYPVTNSQEVEEKVTGKYLSDIFLKFSTNGEVYFVQMSSNTKRR